jgi:hypothetical protein
MSQSYHSRRCTKECSKSETKEKEIQYVTNF